MSSDATLPLYLSTNISDLNDKSDVDTSEIIRNMNRYSKSLDNIFAKAVTNKKKGDQEQAYVMYMRYGNIYTTIMQNVGNADDKSYYKQLYSTKFRTCTEEASYLSLSLISRYEKLNAANTKPITPTEPDVKPKTKKELQREEKSTTATISAFMSVIDVHKLITKCTHILMLDIRSIDRYLSQHIHYSPMINIPTDTHFAKSATISKISKTLKPKDLSLFQEFDQFQKVIIYDEDTWSDSIKDHSKLKIFMDAFYKWDKPQRCWPLALDGGFAEWKLRYPTFVEGKSPAADDHIDGVSPRTSPDQLARITYDLDSLDVNSYNQRNEPSFNRNKKPPLMPPEDHTNKNDELAALRSKNLASKDHYNKIAEDNILNHRLRSEYKNKYYNRDNKNETDKERKAPAATDTLHDIADRERKHSSENTKPPQGLKTGATTTAATTATITATTTDTRMRAITDDNEDKPTLYPLSEVNHMKSLKKQQKQQLRQQQQQQQLEEKLKLQLQQEQHQREQKRLYKQEQQQQQQQQKQQQKPDAGSSGSSLSSFDSTKSLKINELKSSMKSVAVARPSVPSTGSKPSHLIGAKPPAPNRPVPDGSVLNRVISSTDSLRPLRSRSAGLHRSHSSPNVAEMCDESDQSEASTVIPVIDRSTKKMSLHTNSSSSSILNNARVRNFGERHGVVDKGATGLRNLGNTCYMNSVIQALSSIPLLTEFFTGDLYMEHINRKNILGCNGDMATEFAEVLKYLWSGRYKSISPIDLKLTITRNREDFAGYAQQDAQELLCYLLDSLHEDLNKVITRYNIKEQNNDNMSDMEAASHAWQQYKVNNNSFFVDNFMGQFKSTVTCLTCSKNSVTFDTFLYLSLPVISRTTDIMSCITQFHQEELMTNESRWNCTRCHTKREATKRLEIWKLPKILVIHLKRFEQEGRWRSKINSMVHFPFDLNLRSYVVGPCTNSEFTLNAVSNHYGNMEGGHYTAFCKNKTQWLNFDDQDVRSIEEDDVETKQAYILFYSSTGL